MNATRVKWDGWDWTNAIALTAAGGFFIAGSSLKTDYQSQSQSQESRLINSSAKITAFLDTIAWAETGTVEPSSYKALGFSGHFSNFATHPMIRQCAIIHDQKICSYAAGRYQIMNYEWDRFQPMLHLEDFSPDSQDKIALQLIKEKGALGDIEAGSFDKAACKVGSVWASFPCNNYDQNPRSITELKSIYTKQLAKYNH